MAQQSSRLPDQRISRLSMVADRCNGNAYLVAGHLWTGERHQRATCAAAALTLTTPLQFVASALRSALGDRGHSLDYFPAVLGYRRCREDQPRHTGFLVLLHHVGGRWV